MMKHSPIFASTALALILGATPVFALTADEAWEGLEAMLTTPETKVTVGSKTKNGDVLELTDVKVSSEATSDDVKIVQEIDMGSWRLQELGDGKVEFILPKEMTGTIYPEGRDKQSALKYLITQENTKTIASGTRDSTSYEGSADSLTFKVIEARDDEGKPIDIKLEGVVSSITSNSTLERAADGTVVTKGKTTAADATLTASGSTTDTGETFAISATVKDLSADVAADLNTAALAAAQSDLKALLGAGFRMDGKFATGPVTFSVETESGAEGKSTVTGSFDSSESHSVMNTERADYGFSVKGGSFNAMIPSASIPETDGKFGEIALRFDLPLAEQGPAQPFNLVTKFVDVTVSESVWALIDAGKVLPRDPATFILDVTGTGKGLMVDNPEEAMSAELESLSLKEVLVSAIGFKGTAGGDLTFDNSDRATYGGIPAPTGKITVNLQGLNGVLEKLVSIGLVSSDDVTGLRMGLAMLARPGAGSDELISEIEFKGKSLFVNGQQLQ